MRVSEAPHTRHPDVLVQLTSEEALKLVNWSMRVARRGDPGLLPEVSVVGEFFDGLAEATRRHV